MWGTRVLNWWMRVHKTLRVGEFETVGYWVDDWNEYLIRNHLCTGHSMVMVARKMSIIDFGTETPSKRRCSLLCTKYSYKSGYLSYRPDLAKLSPDAPETIAALSHLCEFSVSKKSLISSLVASGQTLQTGFKPLHACKWPHTSTRWLITCLLFSNTQHFAIYVCCHWCVWVQVLMHMHWVELCMHWCTLQSSCGFISRPPAFTMK